MADFTVSLLFDEAVGRMPQGTIVDSFVRLYCILSCRRAGELERTMNYSKAGYVNMDSAVFH